MNITVIGTGYVGLVTGTVFAELGNTVTGVDIDQKKIEFLRQGKSPIYEPGLEELIQKNQKSKRLQFTTNLKDAVRTSKVIFIAVGTPSDENGEADLTHVKQVAHDLGKLFSGDPHSEYKIIVNKSTVPVGTGTLVEDIIREHYHGDFDVVSNPEFLREGFAVRDCLEPDRIVIGNGNPRARQIMNELYKPLNCPIIFTDVKSAEMIKYASNAFLATSISFINSIAQICEKVDADIEKVAEGMKWDKRIGKHAFLNAGCGYGGSCFPKDTKALIQIAHNNNFHFKILEAVEEVNERQKKSLVEKLKKTLNEPLKDKKIAVWGLAFKPRTDDMRESVSISVIHALSAEGAKIHAFDPVAENEAKKIFQGKNILYADTPFETAKDAEAVIIITDWDEFRQIDLDELRNNLKKPIIIDGRNIFDPKIMEQKGFHYLSVGR